MFKIKSKFFAAMLVLLLAACDKTPQPPMMYGGGERVSDAPIWLADELGYYADVNLKLAGYANSAEVTQALRERKVQVAILTLDEALLLRRDIPDLKIVLLLAEYADGAHASGKQYDVLAARDEDIGPRHREMVGLVQGWRRALDEMQKDPAKAMPLMAARKHLDAESFANAWRGVTLLGWASNQELLLDDPPRIAPDLDAAQRFLLSRGLIQMGGDAVTLVQPALLSEKDAGRE
ncbi:MAG: hypothetical protein LBE50_00700 [Gallionellaceae bacterium]|nr:hypothetical protein [Gallionellaceae bacterium]